ncbi:hypothetical protein [Methylocapsa aurea]|uniref:hypothetical protein n=1 Tax=Methylocapsa aurea TaxID=663610 RepID=UPI000561DD67|nr:hypothetical protein [Methylocapsa aurea]
MTILIIGGVLFGTILGRFFKVLILVPVSALAIVLVLAGPALAEHSLARALLEIFALITSLQIGYAAGVVSINIPVLSQNVRKSWTAHHTHSTASRSFHVW